MDLKELPHDGFALAGLALYVFGGPLVAILTARRQNKVDAKLSDSDVKLDTIIKAIGGADNQRIDRIESILGEVMKDVKALREGQRDTLKETREQLAHFTDLIDRRMDQLETRFRHESHERRRKAKRTL